MTRELGSYNTSGSRTHVRLDMRPLLAVDNSEHRAFRDSVLPSNRSKSISCGVGGADRDNLFLAEFSHAVLVTLQSAATTLVVHVFHIVSLCSQKKMIGITARRIVAFVKYVHALWYWSISQLPRQPMSAFSFVATILAPEITVSKFSPRCLPFPAFIVSPLGYFFPESFSEWPSTAFSAVTKNEPVVFTGHKTSLSATLLNQRGCFTAPALA